MSQLLIERGNYDYSRSVRTLIMGYTVIPVSMYFWYNKMLVSFFAAFSKSSWVIRKKVLVTLLLDQTLFANYMCTSYLFWISVLELKPWEQHWRNVTNNYKKVILMNYSFWPFVNYLNFSYVPMQFRILVINLCAVL